jgi:hypothetical protein
MTRRLLSATAIALFLSIAPGPAQAGSYGEGGYFDQPATFVALEGAYAFNASSRNASFDPAVDKLGNIYDIEPAKPGGDGWQGKAELGQSINSDWDYRVSLSAINLEPDTAFSDNIPLAEQDLGLQTLDLELGYHPDHFGPLQARVFAGLRGIHSENQIVMRTFSAGGNETLTDTAFAGGPVSVSTFPFPWTSPGLHSSARFPGRCSSAVSTLTPSSCLPAKAPPKAGRSGTSKAWLAFPWRSAKAPT